MSPPLVELYFSASFSVRCVCVFVCVHVYVGTCVCGFLCVCLCIVMCDLLGSKALILLFQRMTSIQGSAERTALYSACSATAKRASDIWTEKIHRYDDLGT